MGTIKKRQTDLRVPVLIMLFIGFIDEIFFTATLDWSKIEKFIFESEYERLQSIYNTIWWLSIVVPIIPFFYCLYKRRWKDIGFLLLIWLSPFALMCISGFFYYVDKFSISY